MKDKMPINMRKYSDPDYDPNQIIQTGFLNYNIICVNVLLQSSAGITSFGVMADNGTYTIDEFEKAGSVDSAFFNTLDDDTPFINTLEAMAKGSWLAIRKAVYGGAWPTFPTWVGNYPQVYAAGYEQFKRGLLGENWDAWSTANTNGIPDAADDAHDAACGLAWCDYGVGTNDNDYQQYCRLAYVMGLAMQDKFPDLSIRIESSNNATVVERNIQVLYMLVPIALCDFWYLSAMQSDVAVFNLAGLQDGLTSKKIPTEIFNAVDQAWAHFVAENKYDVISTSITGMNNYTSDFIGHTLIEATTLDAAIHNWKTKYQVSGWALKMARSMWGIGKYEAHGETVHFMNLLNGAIQNTGYTTHGVTTWELGVNLAVGLDYLANRETMAKDIALFVKKKNYTWSEVNQVYGDFYTNFSVLEDLKGFAEPETYKPLRRTIVFGDDPDATTFVRGDPISSDPEVLFTDDSNTAIMDDNSMSMTSEWVYLMLNAYLPNWYALHCPYDWSESELSYALLFGLLFDTGADPDIDHDASCDRWTAFSLRLVQMINAKKPDDVIALCSSGNNETARFEDITDPTDCTAFQSISYKYAVELIDRVPTPHQIMQGPRPKGWDGAAATVIDNIGHRDVAHQLLANCIRLVGKTPSSTVGKPQTDSKPDENTVGDGPDGEIE